MKVYDCLILSAGFGIRMGKLGELIPKPAWPLFEKTIIELQVAMALNMGCKNIFINTHHKHNILIDMKNKFPNNVRIVYEDKILGIGGAIYNICRKNDLKGRHLLILNSDVFNYMDPNQFKESTSNFSDDFHVALYGVKVKRNSGYSKLNLENNILKGIALGVNVSDNSYITYSGMGIINTSKLEDKKGFCNFFDTVANYKYNKVKVLLQKELEYFDFGTKDKYFNQMFYLLGKSNNSEFFNFLKNENAILEQKINKNNLSYNSSHSGIINLLEDDLYVDSNVRRAIIWKSSIIPMKIISSGIYYGDNFEEI